MKYPIYASKIEEIEKSLNKIQKKAEKYNVPFKWDVSEPYAKTIRVYGYDNTVLHTVDVEAVDLTIEADQLVKMNGWKLRAKIEHGAEGNIVTPIGNGEVLKEWYTAPPKCDHCGVNRFRSVTFICENESGELRQVGRSCLKDYTGIDPSLAALWASVTDLFPNGMDCSVEAWEEHKPAQMFNVRKVLALACESIERFGYRKSSENSSTKERVIAEIHAEPSEEAYKSADSIINWMAERKEKTKMEDEFYHELYEKYAAEDSLYDEDYWREYRVVSQAWDAVSDLERNCIPLIDSGYCKMMHMGRLVYLPIAHKVFLERKEREKAKAEAREKALATSKHIGEVGQRITVTAEKAELVTSWENFYGTTWLYRFTDPEGNIFIWYASRPIEYTNGMKIRGTIKDHSEYDGIKQTVMTRCAVA